MSQTTLDELAALDPALLTDIVRQDQRAPAFDLLDWSVAPLSHAKIIDTTGGLYRFRGRGHDINGVRHWSIALKVVNQPEGSGCQQPREWCYWKRELLAFESEMLANLPEPIRAPRCYGVTEREAGGWIWMEYIAESTGRRWSRHDFQRAAYALGRAAGTLVQSHTLPDQPWLSEPFFRSIFADGAWWARHMATDTPESIWRSPLVERAFTPKLRRRVLDLWAEKTRFFDALDRLPQLLCHHDCHRRNLLWHTGEHGQDELIVLDWAFCGSGGVGMDLGELVASSTYFFESEPTDIAVLEAAVLNGYLSGLRDSGWAGDARLVRLGYTACAALWMGATLPGWAAVMLDPASGVDVLAMYGRPVEEVLAGWVTLTEYLLDRADEARRLMRELAIR